jgi:hypothetical protein
MRTISTAGFEKPESVRAGVVPTLEWLQIADLVVDPTYQRPIMDKGRQNVSRIARAFSWSCFTPVVVSPLAGSKFAIIDGQHRTTAAALVGFDRVPCQIVVAARAEQAAAFKAINSAVTPVSRMALQAAAVVASEPCAVQVADICARAEVELLRYPVPVDRQVAGQTMAVGAIAQCLRRYGQETLITALQCVTQTKNNRPGVLSARMIKALCTVLDGDPVRRDGGLALLDAFDAIDLVSLQSAAADHAAVEKISPVQTMSERIRSELGRLFPATQNGARAGRQSRGEDNTGLPT